MIRGEVSFYYISVSRTFLERRSVLCDKAVEVNTLAFSRSIDVQLLVQCEKGLKVCMDRRGEWCEEV